MSQQRQGVLIAIDWENIRRGAQLYGRTVKPAELCRAISDVGDVFGEVKGGKAFGDWSLRPDDGREFAEQAIVPYHAPRTAAGKDRSDPAILLEVYDWIRDREDCATIILGSGDADYQVLVDRARLYGRRIVLCAFSQSVSQDMLATAPLFPLEAELGIQLAEHGDVEVPVAMVPEVEDTGVDDLLARFVQEMYRLEGRMNFVGYGMLCNQWMLDWGMGWNEHECRRLVDEYSDAGIVERHEVINRKTLTGPRRRCGWCAPTRRCDVRWGSATDRYQIRFWRTDVAGDARSRVAGARCRRTGGVFGVNRWGNTSAGTGRRPGDCDRRNGGRREFGHPPTWDGKGWTSEESQREVAYWDTHARSATLDGPRLTITGATGWVLVLDRRR